MRARTTSPQTLRIDLPVPFERTPDGAPPRCTRLELRRIAVLLDILVQQLGRASPLVARVISQKVSPS